MAGWQLRVATNAAASAWQDITGYVERTTARFTGQAFDGQIGQGGVDLDDSAGNIVIPGLRVWELNKDGLVLERGRIGSQDFERGVNRTADAHERDITLIDCNADLSRIGVHGWSRPEESDRARVLALVSDFLNGSPRASTVIGTAGVRNANTRTLPAKRYDNENPHSVLQHIADTAAKIFFVTVADDGSMDLFYDISTYTGYAAGISITDDAPDEVTEFPPINPTRSVDPEELFGRVRLTYGNGRTSVTAVNAAVETAHDYLETIYHDDSSTASTAQHRANTFLDIKDQEEITRRCAVAVPEANLADIRRGMTISYRSAATNDLTPTTRRIAQLTWQPPIADGQAWLAILELDLPLKIGQRYTKPKPPSDLEKAHDQAITQPYCVLTFPRETFTRSEASDLGISEFPNNPDWNTTSGGTSLSVDGTRAVLEGSPSQRASATVHVPMSGVLEFLIHCVATDKDFDGSSEGFLWFGDGVFGVDPAVLTINLSQTGAPLAVGSTCTVVLYAPGPSSISATVSKPIAIGSPVWIRVLVDGGDLFVAMAAGSPPNGTIWDDTNSFGATPSAPNDIEISSTVDEQFEVDDIAILQGAGDGCRVIGWFSSDAPVPGQQVDEDLGLGDGTTTTFTLDHPASPGTLEVEVDGIDQTPAIIYDDADTFHLSFAPEADERVRVSYKAA